MTSAINPSWINDDSVEPLVIFVNSQLARSAGTMPGDCPVCETPSSVHIHAHRFYDQIGGSWVWCSACRRYDHDRRNLPDWWVNNDAIGLDLLESPPAALDEWSGVVDEHWNSLRGGDRQRGTP